MPVLNKLRARGKRLRARCQRLLRRAGAQSPPSSHDQVADQIAAQVAGPSSNIQPGGLRQRTSAPATAPMRSSHTQTIEVGLAATGVEPSEAANPNNNNTPLFGASVTQTSIPTAPHDGPLNVANNHDNRLTRPLDGNDDNLPLFNTWVTESSMYSPLNAGPSDAGPSDGANYDDNSETLVNELVSEWESQVFEPPSTDQIRNPSPRWAPMNPSRGRPSPRRPSPPPPHGGRRSFWGATRSVFRP